jgi:hypothetical protein
MTPGLAAAIFDDLLSLNWRQARRVSGNRRVLCPLHDDHSPSLDVHEENLAWICRAGCGGGGAWDLAVRMLGEGGARELLTRLEANSSERRHAEHPRHNNGSSVPCHAVEILCDPTAAQIAALKRSRRLQNGDTLRRIGAKLVRARFRRDEASPWGPWEEWLGFPTISPDSWKLWALNRNGVVRLDAGKLIRRNAGPVSLILSPALREAAPGSVPVVHDTEGESDFLAALKAGFAFVLTTTGGAGSLGAHVVNAEWLRALLITEVIAWGDLDEAGRHGAEKRAEWWRELGVSVRVPMLPEALGHGGDLRDYLNGRLASDGSPAVEPLGDAAALGALASGAELREPRKGRRAGLGLVSLSDLLREPEEDVRWLVDDLLPQGGLSALAGKPKAGKSTLARALALAVAQGKDFLGRRVNQGDVIYLALEEKRSELRRHFAAMGARPEDPNQIRLLVGRAPEDVVPLLAAEAAASKPDLIVVDTLARFARVKDVSDYAQVMAALEPVLAIARETGAHVMLVHHAKKGEVSGGDSILGSTAIFGSVDTALILRRTESARLLSSFQRYGTDLPETVVELDAETQAPRAAGLREEIDLRDAGERIIEFLAAAPGPLTEDEIDQGVEGRRALKVKALRALHSGQRVERSGAGKKGDRFQYSVRGSTRTDSNCGSQVPDTGWEPGNQNPLGGETHAQRESGSQEGGEGRAATEPETEWL